MLALLLPMMQVSLVRVEDPLSGCRVNTGRLQSDDAPIGGLFGAQMLDEAVCLRNAMSRPGLEATRNQIAEVAKTKTAKETLVDSVRAYLNWSQSTMAARHRTTPKAADGQVASYEVQWLEGDILKNLRTDFEVGLVLDILFDSRAKDYIVTNRVSTTGRPHAVVFEEVGKLKDDELWAEYNKLRHGK
jgi:hypothetical protein